MKHTVVIPLYNKEAYVYDTIRSLAFQDKKAAQVVIIDDFSTDQSLANLKEALSFFAPQFLQTKVQIIELKENARNMGIELATGDLISFLDADDCYVSSCLRDVSTIMEKENIDVLVLGILLVPSNYYMPNIKSFEKELISLSNDLFIMPDPLHTVSSPDFIMGVGSNVVVRKNRLTNICYEVDVSLNEGIDFWYRVLKNTPASSRVGLLNKTCIEVREVDGSLSRIRYLTWKELEIPVSILRYRESTNRYDQQLMGMLSQRWLSHAMKRLPSVKEKGLFLFHHCRLLIKNSYYLKTRSK
jgi:glycosyltransferase involved in cell wall biosynthesis